MVITLRGIELQKKNQIINEKQAEGYTLTNVLESFDGIMSGPDGTFSTPTIELEFKKL